MISTAENNLLFDDLALLENRLGIGSLKVTSVNANCDCDGYYSTPNKEECDTNQIARPAPATA
jgi:hypothetical protein